MRYRRVEEVGDWNKSPSSTTKELKSSRFCGGMGLEKKKGVVMVGSNTGTVLIAWGVYFLYYATTG